MRNVNEISSFIDEITKRHDVKKRKYELKQILDKFAEIYYRDHGITIEYAENSDIILAYFHFYLLNQRVKNYIEENSNVYKMASTTELTINYVQPIISISSNVKSLRVLNAELSMYSAIGFIQGWYDIDFYLGSGIDTLNDSIDTILNERLKILSNLNLESSMPILFNSQTWEIFHLLVQYYSSAAMIR